MEQPPDQKPERPDQPGAGPPPPGAPPPPPPPGTPPPPPPPPPPAEPPPPPPSEPPPPPPPGQPPQEPPPSDGGNGGDDGSDESVEERFSEYVAEHGGGFRLSVAFGIVIVSILAAAMAWQASQKNETSANTDELSRQAVVQRQLILSTHDQTVNQDLRVFNRYEEHSLLGRELRRDGRKLGGDFATRAQQEIAQAKALTRFFYASQPEDYDGDGHPAYSPKFARNVLEASDTQLEVLRPDELRATAKGKHLDAVRLTGLAALFVAALLFLTLAELTQAGVSRIFAATGGGVAVIALGLFIVVLI